MEIREERVEFEVGGDTVVANVFLPVGAELSPAVILEGPLTSVKEQISGNYARALAKRGFICLAMDHRHFGESGGSPRFLEDPNRKVEDIRAAIDYLCERPDVNANRITAVGVCAGAGYISQAVAADPRIVAWGAIAGFFHDVAQQREWMKDGYETAIAGAMEAEAHFEATGESREIPAVGKGEVAMPLDEAFEYYGTERGSHPNYKNCFALMSRMYTLPWDSMSAAETITVPTLMIHSEKALAPMLARRFFDKLTGPKEELWVESIGQIDFYDRPERIEPAADALQAHFQRAS